MSTARGESLTNTIQRCRFCASELKAPFLDLGRTPLANSYLKELPANGNEPHYPLRLFVCEECKLVQQADFTAAEDIFTNEYAYFSSFTASWLEHARKYTEAMIDRFGIDQTDLVVEIASNDGYLLQYFQQRGIPVLGIEPAGNCAEVAERKGIPTLVKFFGLQTARELESQGTSADLIVGNNVLAHVPDVNDFVSGMKVLLAEEGIITMEFPHLLRLLAENQFDTIYHEHFSYFSLTSVETIFNAHGLTIFDVQELPTHGGSLRIFARHREARMPAVSARVPELKEIEDRAGLNRLDTYARFATEVEKTRDELLSFLRQARLRNQTVVGYGAPAKGNTLLNFCGVRGDLLPYTVDVSPHKQGTYLPGSHLPVLHPDQIRETRPDYILILCWNIREEVVRSMACVTEWGGKFVVPIPQLRVLD
jgi:SAM-dependent methyltransferase